MRLWLVLIALPLIAAPQPESSGVAKLTLLVYDLTGMRRSDLAEALNQTTRIFRAAGVELSWTAGSPTAPEAHLLDLSVPTATLATPARLIVARIINKRTPAFPSGALGWSLPTAQAGAHVTVFLEEIQRLQPQIGVSVPCLLGYALAHELGHVLMLSSAHSPRGLMRAEWSRAELDRIQHGALKFSEAEAKALRASLRAANDALASH
jgi:hypothetical protein